MVRRSSWRWWQRVVSACLAVWFTMVTVDQTVLHACPMHGAAATAAAPAAGAHEHAPQQQHTCSCVGHCCTTTAVFAPALPVRIACVALAAPQGSTGRPDHDYVASWVDFVLPFSTAPPASLPA